MVIENYISTTNGDDPDYIMNIPVPLYTIILSPNIPYIDTYKELYDNTTFPNEQEIILPRNLIAELVEIDNEPDLRGNFGHTIKLTPMYPTQFDVLKKKCSEHNVYTIEKYNDSDLKTIVHNSNGGDLKHYKINNNRKTKKSYID
jgi:hypothetical protein